MLRRTAWFVAAVLAVGCGLLLLSPSHDPVEPAAGPPQFDFVFRPVRSTSGFNTRLSVRSLAPPATFRVLVNCQEDGETHYGAEFADGAVQLSRVEYGMGARIGTVGRADFGDGRAHEVVVKRRQGDLTVTVDGRSAAQAFDTALQGGEVGVGVREGSIEVSGLRVQPVEDAFFYDDFMRSDTDPGPWRVLDGVWHVRALENPSLSSNATCYMGKGKPTATCTTGHWFWDNYRAAVSCRPHSDAAFGLYFCYRDPENHFLLRWESGDGTGEVQAVRRTDGRTEVVARAEIGFQPEQWYRLEAAVNEGRACLSLDGNPVLAFSDPGLCFGRIGLYTEDTGRGTEFDDVAVRSWRAFSDDFGQQCMGKWLMFGGDWRWIPGGNGETDAHDGRLEVSCSAAAKALTGLPDWSNYTLAADLGPSGHGAIGLLFHYRDEDNYYLWRWHDGEESVSVCELIKVVAGEEKLLARETASWGTGTAIRSEVRTDRGFVRVSVDGAVVSEAFDTTFDCGRIGLFADRCSSAWFDNVAVSFHDAVQPLVTPDQAFAHEKSMQVWAGAASDWDHPPAGSAHGRAGLPVSWHRACFAGDVAIEAEVASLKRGSAMGLVVGAGRADPLDEHRFELRRTDHGWTGALFEGPAVVGRTPLTGGSTPAFVRLRRTGRFVGVDVDGQCLLWRESALPTAGAMLGHYGGNAAAAGDKLRVYTEQVYNDLFQTAPVDWRVACGTWEVTNRWDCDPRWSFFSGRGEEGLAAIWNKREFSGNLVVEFYASIRMQRNRGKQYEYAGDINLTLCGDGRDLTSGYSFLFGGWDDTATCIVRRRAIVARTRDVLIPREKEIHRRWFYIRAEKRGQTLKFLVDNVPVLTYTDPQPLPGGQVAVWTHNNSLMVARVRVSFEGPAPREMPSAGPGHVPECVYDVIPHLARAR